MQVITTELVVELALRFAIDVAAMAALVFGLYYRRYRDKELVITAGMFNLFAFVILTILSSVEFGLAAGFGLFAILALFTLRSEEISKTEITYFFGSVSLAVICSTQGTEVAFVAVVVAVVLVAAWVIDHPNVLASVDTVKLTLDRIDRCALSDPEATRRALSERLGVDVMSYRITFIDYVNDVVRVTAHYRTRAGLPTPRAVAAVPPSAIPAVRDGSA